MARQAGVVRHSRHVPTHPQPANQHRIVVTKTLICLKDLAWPNP
jgi:hypothetical protein